MVVVPESVLTFLTTHHGVITSPTLRRFGITDGQRRSLLRQGILVRVAKDVYALAGTPDTLERRARIAGAPHPNGYLTGPTTATIAGFRCQSGDRRLHLMVPHGLHVVTPPGVTLHQCRMIDPELDIVRRADGLVIASPARLAFDCASMISQDSLFSLIEDMRYRRRVTTPELVAMARRLCHPNRPGSRVFEDTLLLPLPGGPMESLSEIEVGPMLAAMGIPLIAQFPLTIASGDIRFDFAVPALRWAIEVDVHPRHYTTQGRADDARRDRECADIGWRVDRVTRIELLDLPTRATELHEVYLQRRTGSEGMAV
jgi:hypothetical protein